MFDINSIPQSEMDSIKFIRIREEIKRRLETVFTGMVEFGWISLYLETRDKWPLITIESYTDSPTFDASGRTKHQDEIRIRATVKCLKSDAHNPDSVLRYCLRKFESLLCNPSDAVRDGGFFLTTPNGERLLNTSLSTTQPSQFVLPEPGLPYASVHMSLKVSYIENKP